jgi:hypothetical protein
MQSATDMINQITHHLSPHIIFEFIAGYKAVVLLMLIGYLMHFAPRNIEFALQEKLTSMPLAYKAAFMLIIIVVVIQTKSAGIQPFIYFQF